MYNYQDKPTINKAAAMESIKMYFEKNEEVFVECIELLDGYNGYLGDDRRYNMDELEEFVSGMGAFDLLNCAYFGRDDDNWTTDSSGNKHYDSFNPNRKYFYFNGYGNLCSTNWKDYSAHLDDYAIEEMLNNRVHVDTIDNDLDLSILFDDLEDAED